jgi:hypothetical protein
MTINFYFFSILFSFYSLFYRLTEFLNIKFFLNIASHNWLGKLSLYFLFDCCRRGFKKKNGPAPTSNPPAPLHTPASKPSERFRRKYWEDYAANYSPFIYEGIQPASSCISTAQTYSGKTYAVEIQEDAAQNKALLPPHFQNPLHPFLFFYCTPGGGITQRVIPPPGVQ